MSLFSWVNNFGHEGLGLLLDALEKLLDKKQWVSTFSVFYFVFVLDCVVIKCLLQFSGKRVLIKGTSTSLSSAWKLSWTTRFVWVNVIRRKLMQEFAKILKEKKRSLKQVIMRLIARAWTFEENNAVERRPVFSPHLYLTTNISSNRLPGQVSGVDRPG